jgi:uncharacterized protein DUF4124
MNRLWIGLAVACVGMAAHAADMYKCTNAAGKVEFRDRPCDGAAGEKLKAKDNSAGTGDNLAGVHAKDAAFKARQDAKRDAEDKANAEAYAAAEKAWQQERAHQDSVAIREAIENAGGPPPGSTYTYVPPRPQKIVVEIKPTDAHRHHCRGEPQCA